ncbi:MAG: DNA polymerase IV [Candidatus Syntrophoarchaeum sp. GoM_oil]|nr:MAG: DNA polymerase IV [Candidatus Syntrophoarchaeum sp. GoM_oil]
MQKSHRHRIIFHVDMDSFYAAVEVGDNPSLKGLPVVVGANPKKGEGRGVVSTCSYEARSYGVRSGMPISKAFQLLLGKDAVFLPVRMQRYKEISNEIMDVLKSYADRFQQVSIDEAFLDLTDRFKRWDDAKEFARQIKQEILEITGLTCSIGCGPNKSVSKIASGFEKPDGLTIVMPDDVIDFLSPLSVTKISGVGSKTEERLNALGIYTIGQLKDADVKLIESEFGEIGLKIGLLAGGIDEGAVKERGEPKSIGFEDTFDVDTDDELFIEETLDRITEKIHERLLKERYGFKTVTVKIRFENFETHTRSKTIRIYSNDKKEVKTTSKDLLGGFGTGKKIRLIGVRVSNLRKMNIGQRELDEYF